MSDNSARPRSENPRDRPGQKQEQEATSTDEPHPSLLYDVPEPSTAQSHPSRSPADTGLLSLPTPPMPPRPRARGGMGTICGARINSGPSAVLNGNEGAFIFVSSAGPLSYSSANVRIPHPQGPPPTQGQGKGGSQARISPKPSSPPVQRQGNGSSQAQIPPLSAPSVQGQGGLGTPASRIPPLSSVPVQGQGDLETPAPSTSPSSSVPPVPTSRERLRAPRTGRNGDPASQTFTTQATEKKGAPVDNVACCIMQREIGMVSRPSNLYPASGRASVTRAESTARGQATRSTSLELVVYFNVAPERESGKFYVHRMSIPQRWSHRTLVNYKREGRRLATIRPLLFSIMPHSAWRDLVRTGFDLIQARSLTEPLVACPLPAAEIDDLPRLQQGYNFVKISLKSTPVLSLPEGKRVAQAAFYFGKPLAQMLNGGSNGTKPLSDKFDKYRYQAIDDIEEHLADFDALSKYTGTEILYHQPLRVHISASGHHAIEIYFHSYPRALSSTGVLLVEQIDLLISFVEAALGIHSCHWARLQHQFPATVVGLGRFINQRGNETESRNDGGGKLIVTPFIKSMSLPAAEKIGRQIALPSNEWETKTPIAYWRQNSSHCGDRQYGM